MFSHNKPLPDSLESKELKVSLYLDFDGTLTAASGAAAINRMYYGMIEKDENNPHYADARFLSKEYEIEEGVKHTELDLERLKKILINRFKYPTYKQFALTEQATQFLTKMLQPREDNIEIKVYLISRNRTEYIRAICFTAGLLKDQMSKLTIIDALSMQSKNMNKYSMVKALEQKHQSDVIIIADDNQGDFDQMKKGATESSKASAFIHCFNEATGKFNFGSIDNELEQSIQSLQSAVTKLKP